MRINQADRKGWIGACFGKTKESGSTEISCAIRRERVKIEIYQWKTNSSDKLGEEEVIRPWNLHHWLPVRKHTADNWAGRPENTSGIAFVAHACTLVWMQWVTILNWPESDASLSFFHSNAASNLERDGILIAWNRVCFFMCLVFGVEWNAITFACDWDIGKFALFESER